MTKGGSYRGLEKQHYALLDLLVPAHFIWQINTKWIMIKRRPTHEQTYEEVRKPILTPQPNDEYDYLTALKGPEYNSKTGRWEYAKK